MPSIKGTASVTDPRARSKALKSTKFPSNFSKAVHLSKINKSVMKQWIEQKVTSILGFDDEIVSSTAINLFLPSDGEIGSSSGSGSTSSMNPDPRRAQLDLVGFLGKDEAASFAKELWTLLLEAQSSGSGIPRTLLEQKKRELSLKASAAAAAAGKQLNAALPSGFAAANNSIGGGARVSHGNRNPEMNRFVQEAARRAQAARQMVGAPIPPQHAAAAPNAPTLVPLSPPHVSENAALDQKRPASSAKSTKEWDEDDRKLSPRDSFGRATYNNPSLRSKEQYTSDKKPSYAESRDNRTYRNYSDATRSSRNRDGRSDDRDFRGGRSPSSERDRRRGDEEDRRWRQRRRDDSSSRSRSSRRYRYESDDDEIEELERRLSDLKKQLSKNRDDYALDEEIEDVKDRIYELERRRRRHRKERRRQDRVQEDYYNRRKRRRRDRSSPERSRRRSPTPESEDSNRRRRSRRRRSRSRSSSTGSSSSRSRSRSRSRSYDRRRDSPSDRRDRDKERGDRRRDRSKDRSSGSSSHSESSYSD